jgi:inorganic pyrophosphatase/exopolyphosphatase
MLLCAILSDTLNLQGPTTTDWDRLMVAVLAEISGVSDIQLLAQKQFKAKSKELEHLSAHALVNGDQKAFAFDAPGFTGEIGFAVVETTDDDIILQKASKLIPEMVACKKEKNLSMIFLAIVNIVKLKSCLLLCGPSEKALAVDAFGGEISRNDTLMDLGNRVSRKKEFIPVITKIINDGWKRPKNMDRGLSDIGLDKLGHLEVDPNDPYGNVERVGSMLEDESYLDDEEEKKVESDDAKKVVG